MLEKTPKTSQKPKITKQKTLPLVKDIRTALKLSQQYNIGQKLTKRTQSLNNNVNRFLKSYLGHFNKNEFGELRKSMLVLETKPQQYIEDPLDFKPKLFINKKHGMFRPITSEILFKFQIFIVKDTQENVFHYYKFLKGISNKKINRNLKGTLLHLNDFFETIKLKTKDLIQKQANSLQQEMLVFQNFVNSQNFQNLQILVITRIIMKVLIFKIFKDLKTARTKKLPLDETNLNYLLEFYRMAGDDLEQIEDILNGSQSSQYDFDHLKVYPFFKQTYKAIYQGYQSGLTKNCFHISFKGLQNILLTIAEEFMGELKCEDELTDLLTIDTQSSSDEEISNKYSTPRRKLSILSSDSSELSDSKLSELSNSYTKLSQDEHLLDKIRPNTQEINVSDFFGRFQFNLLKDEIFTNSNQQPVPVLNY